MLIFKTLTSILDSAREDLERPHVHAAERVGFFICKPACLNDGYLLVAAGYVPVQDAHYIRSDEMGAVINAAAFRSAMQLALDHNASIFHVHMHSHYGKPRFSRTDLAESEKFVPTFWNVLPNFPHGALVLSRDEVTGRCWLPETLSGRPLDEIVEVGESLRIDRVSHA